MIEKSKMGESEGCETFFTGLGGCGGGFKGECSVVEVDNRVEN